MIPKSVQAAFGLENFESESLTTGLINTTYIVAQENGEKILVQKINTNVFKNPLAIQNNYVLVEEYLKQNNSFHLPALIKTKTGNLLVEDSENGTWRAFEFISDSYSPLSSSTVEEASLVAECFGKFSNDLKGLDTSKIEIVLPGFHDLSWRYQQFQDSLQHALPERKEKAEPLIQKVEEYKYLVEYFNKINADKKNYPLHILHHDCKIANILFDIHTQKIICPVDLDTTQNGLFFSDFGDMIRSMTPSLPESAKEIDNIELRTDFYEAIKKKYLTAMKDELTAREKEEIDIAGPVIIYMQSLRFLTDYLNNDIYYKTEYAEQNFFRTANQLKLLDLVIQYTNAKLFA